MGNQSSNCSSSPLDVDRLRHFSRNAGSLGLSRQELDKRCRPSGLYGGCAWDEKAIRRLIADGRIASRLKGHESPDSTIGATEECPICFLMYTEVNTTTCCNAKMCTECFLQVRPQKEKESTCPFCNCNDFSVVISKTKTLDIEDVCPSDTSTSTSSSFSDSTDSSTSTNSTGNLKKKSAALVAPHTPSCFGSQLAKDARFQMMRDRSQSFASSDGTSTPKIEHEIIQSIAMTGEERKKLEEEMKAQHFHPLVLRLEAEAHERRLENDRAYQNSSASRNQQSNDSSSNRGYHMTRRARTTRNWEQLAHFFDQGEEIDDMTALETAILFNRMTEREQADDNGDSSGNNNGELDGFPLLRSLLTGHVDSNQVSASSGRSHNFRTSRRQRSQFMRSNVRHRGMNDVALGTASMMMHGISEEEQLSMAIAASMQDQQIVQNDGDNSIVAEVSNEMDATISNSDNNDRTPANSDSRADSLENSSSSVAQGPGEQLKRQSNGDEESTITELARVVTDTSSPNADSIFNGIAA